MYLFINTTQKESIIMFFQDENIIDFYIWESSNNQSEELLVNINKVIKSNNKSLKDLKGIVVITGPGSYTGIRVGVATANALAFSLNIKILGMNMLDILSAYYFDINFNSNAIIVLIHAIYEKYYYAKYYRDDSNNVIRQDVGNEELIKIIQNNEAECLALQTRDKILEIDNKIELSNVEFQKSIVRYITKLLRKTKKINYAHPFYLNQPNITRSK